MSQAERLQPIRLLLRRANIAVPRRSGEGGFHFPDNFVYTCCIVIIEQTSSHYRDSSFQCLAHRRSVQPVTICNGFVTSRDRLLVLVAHCFLVRPSVSRIARLRGHGARTVLAVYSLSGGRGAARPVWSCFAYTPPFGSPLAHGAVRWVFCLRVFRDPARHPVGL